MKRSIGLSVLVALIPLMLSSCDESNKLDKDVSLIFTSNVHGHLLEDSTNVSFGYDGLALYKSEKLGITPYVSLIDLGNYSSGNKKVEESNGSLAIDIMNKVQYDYGVLQDNEFAYGLDNASTLIKDAKFTYLASNLHYQGNDEDKLKDIKNYVIVNYGGIKAGLFSLMSSSFMDKYDSSEYKDENGNYIYSLFNDDLNEFYKTVQDTLKEMRSNGASYIIALSTLNDSSPVSLKDVISKTNLIDAAVDGVSSISIASESVNNINNKPVYVTAPGSGFTSISEITITREGLLTASSVNGYQNKESSITKYIKDKLAE